MLGNTIDINSIIDRSPESMKKYGERHGRFLNVADRYRDDESFRASLDKAGAAEILSVFFDFDAPVAEDVRVKIVVDTEEVSHLVLPPDPNRQLRDEQLGDMAGGTSTAGTAGTISTASTVQTSTLPSSLSSAGSAGTVGSAS